jgi:hypothetical protein
MMEISPLELVVVLTLLAIKSALIVVVAGVGLLFRGRNRDRGGSIPRTWRNREP